LQRITEEAEEDLDLMRYLQTHGVYPGATLRVAEIERFNQTLVVEGEQGRVVLGLRAASKLRAVRP